MSDSKNNRMYLAQDVSSRWKKNISNAQKSITVFTPYLDKMLLKLLSKNDFIDKTDITIVTDFNPEHLLQNPNQLLSIKNLIKTGYDVTSLRGLHAKVLLIDEKFISIGSQNFTSRGRKNKEATVFPINSIKGTKIIKTLKNWKHESIEIEEALVDLLISRLKKQFKRYDKFLDEINEIFNQGIEEIKSQRQESIKIHFDKLEKQSRIKLAYGPIYGCVEYLESSSDSYFEIDRAGYYTLRVLYDNNSLVHWNIYNQNGEHEYYRLNRLSIYPIFIADTNQIGFARLAKTRITYVRNSVSWTEPFDILNDSFKVSVTFPKVKTRKSNIEISLGNHAGMCKVGLLFDGKNIAIIDKTYSKAQYSLETSYESFVNTLENHFSSPKPFNNILAEVFSGFKFEEIGIKNKNIQEYLEIQTTYKISIIEFRGNPILVLSKFQGL